MNHKKTTLGIAAIVAALAMTSVAFAIPQQALAGGHHHHTNSIKVDQNTTQLNFCDNDALCDNEANNSADIHR